jgi:hypothetical protein
VKRRAYFCIAAMILFCASYELRALTAALVLVTLPLFTLSLMLAAWLYWILGE